MSDERKEEKINPECLQCPYWQGECIMDRECVHNPFVFKQSEPKPEIDGMEKYVEEKLVELIRRNNIFYSSVQERNEANRKFITQIISDVKGKSVEMWRSDIDKFILLFTTLIGEERQIIIDEWIKYLESAGVKIKKEGGE